MNKGEQLLEKLQFVVYSVEDDIIEFYDSGNKSAGKRARKKMMAVKHIAQEIRIEILEKRKMMEEKPH